MYNEFYGLSEKPFESLPDPRFLFLTTSHRKIITSVLEGIRIRRGFISITGEVGTGKTTLIRYLLSRLEDVEGRKTAFIFHPTITFKELLKNILLELNLEVMKASKGTLLRQLNEYLVQMDFWNETLIVIIDEAQDLPIEVMGELGMLPRGSALQIIFVGQPEFEDKLNLQGLGQLKQRIGVKHQIRAFSEEESKSYINHRLKLVRSSSSERFTPKAISKICSYAKGVPRIINILCDNAFLRGYSLSQKKIDVDVIGEVIKDMEGPLSRKTFFSPIATAIQEFRLFSPRSNSLFSKASLILLVFLCLGGFGFLIDHYFRPGSAHTSRPIQKWIEPISMSNTHQGSDKLKPASPEFLKPSSPPHAPLALMAQEDKPMEIVTVKRGYTVSSLIEIYYGTVNITLMDFMLDLNPEITDVHLILVDQKITLPKITKELLTTKSTDNTYQIQVGTFPTPDFVRFYVNEPALKGKEVNILPRKASPQETWYRVVVGPFGNKDECFRVIDQLKEKRLLPAFGGILKME